MHTDGFQVGSRVELINTTGCVAGTVIETLRGKVDRVAVIFDDLDSAHWVLRADSLRLVTSA